MSVTQGLYARAGTFAVAAVLVAIVVEVGGPKLLAALVGAERAAGWWGGARMAGWSVVFVFAMLAIGRVGAAISYGLNARPDPAEPPE